MRRNELQITPNVSGNNLTTSLKHFGSRQKLPEKRKITKNCVNRFYGAKWICLQETLGDLVEVHRFWAKFMCGRYFLEFFPKKNKNKHFVYLPHRAITRATI